MAAQDLDDEEEEYYPELGSDVLSKTVFSKGCLSMLSDELCDDEKEFPQVITYARVVAPVPHLVREERMVPVAREVHIEAISSEHHKDVLKPVTDSDGDNERWLGDRALVDCALQLRANPEWDVQAETLLQLIMNGDGPGETHDSRTRMTPKRLVQSHGSIGHGGQNIESAEVVPQQRRAKTAPSLQPSSDRRALRAVAQLALMSWPV